MRPAGDVYMLDPAPPGNNLDDEHRGRISLHGAIEPSELRGAIISSMDDLSSQGPPAAATPAAARGDEDEGLGFVTAVYMGQDRIGEVRVSLHPPPPLRRSASQSPPLPPHSSSSSSSWAESLSLATATTATRSATSTPVSEATTAGTTGAGGSVEAARLALGSGIRIAGLSPPSDRCHPLVVMHTVSMDPVWLKLDDQQHQDRNEDDDKISDSKSKSSSPSSLSPTRADRVRSPPPSSAAENPLHRLYKTCIDEAKVAVVPMERGMELLLVAMPGKTGEIMTEAEAEKGERAGCFFWAFSLPAGLYTSCLTMLHTRCLAMVLDLDETLILANTMRSFEDRIDALMVQIDKQRIPVPNKGMDAHKLACLSAELKRYTDDRALLKQFVESDFVSLGNGRIVAAQLEEEVMRPVIRIPERNIILTRVNPAVRDTSVLVRLRPAWEDLRSHLLAKDRRRFQVYICTMSERDYALEMWRLLDPGARLIESADLQRRLVCVKAGSKKSLSSMFQQSHCHPRMAMVIDDRPEVWEDKDQPHVHAVPAFSPYYAPLAETSGPLPVLWIARNVASNVRAGFFKYFDEVLPHKFAQVTYGTDILTLPEAPSAGNYFVAEVENAVAIPENTNGVPKYFPDGITGPEVERALSRKDGTATLLQNGRAHQNGSAGGWLEDEDEEQVNPDSPSNKPSDAVKDEQQDHANGNGEAVLKDVERLVSIARGLNISDPLLALKEFGDKSKTNVEFRCCIQPAQLLQVFHAEVFCDGTKIGGGDGKTNKEAKTRAAEDALKYLTKSSDIGPDDTGPDEDESKRKENSEKRNPSFNAVAALRDMCKIEGSKVEYLERDFSKGLYICEVEVAGEVLGKGTGSDWESARHQAAEQALRAVAAPKKKSASTFTGANTGTGTGTGTGTRKKRYSPPAPRLAKRPRNGDALAGSRAGSKERGGSPTPRRGHFQQRSRRR